MQLTASISKKLTKIAFIYAQFFINLIVNSYEKDWKHCAQGKVYYDMKDTKQFFLLLAFKLH